MADPPELDALPQARVEPPRRRLSVVWVIPILAALVALGIAVQHILSEGPTITIVFKSAEGIEAGKTFIKYKDVNIGQVTAVQLTDDFAKVAITAKIAKSAAGLMVEDAKFWVVSPRITLSGVSGLSTLLSGNYIGFEAGKSDHTQRTFTGLEVAPIITGGEPGRQFVLQARDLGSLGIGAPIYYRRLPVGQVIAYDLAPDGKAVELKIFVAAPYDRYVTTGTRFWNATGFDVSFSADGLSIRTESLVALLAGGLAFDTPTYLAEAKPAATNTVFTLYSDQTTAMKQPDPGARLFVLHFNESLRGLSVGAPVTFLGLPVGEVTSVGLSFDAQKNDLRPRVLVSFYPERLIERVAGAGEAATKAMEESTARRGTLMRHLLEERGLRGQLRSGNQLTGQLLVAFGYFPNAPTVKVDLNKPVPELPVVPSGIVDLEAKVSNILAKLDRVPLEDIGNDLRSDLEAVGHTLRDTRRLLNRVDDQVVPELQASLQEASRTLAAAERAIKDADATLVGTNAPGQQELNEALREVAQAARSLRVLAEYLERHPEALIRGKTQ